MANIFAILTAIVLALSAFLAYQNMGRDTEEGRGYKGWIYKTDNMKKSLARKQDELKKTQDELAATESELSGFQGQNETLREEVAAQKEKNDMRDAEMKSKEAEAEAKATEVSTKEDELKAFGNVDEVLAELEQTQRELAQIEIDIAQREAQRASLEAQRVSTENVVADVREKINWRVAGKSNPDLNTRVGRVYRSLGFVTLPGGDNLGIVKDSPLEVVRDGAVVAKLQVTTVEANTSAADIVPGSVAEGDSVRAGDQVRVPQEGADAPAGNPNPAG